MSALFPKFVSGVPMAHTAVAQVPRLIAELRGHIVRKTGRPIDRDVDFLTTQIETLFMARPIVNEWAGLGLTATERRLLDHLFAHPGRTFTKDAISNALYFAKPGDQPAQKIIDLFVHKVRLKLVAADSDVWIETINGVGFRLVNVRARLGEAQMNGLSNVLVTGGTGTFGHAFTEKVLKADYRRLCIFSRSEHRQAEMRDAFDDQRMRFFIGDVRDRDRLRRAMEGIDLVVHAAALKRIEVGHYDPIEMVKTNVNGTINVIEAAIDAGVKKVIGLSSDKAYQPVSPYGCSKAMAESLLLAANNMRGVAGPRFAVVRYGNIAGSNGSVIPKWRTLTEMGHKDVPVTDPDCTRFWMRADEAVALVLNTAVTMKGGELVIPQELPAYRLGDLAEAMRVKTKTVGLPDWEKKHESMGGPFSDSVRRLSVRELREELGAIAA